MMVCLFQGNEIRIGYGGRYYRDNYNETLHVPLKEGEWRLVDKFGNIGQLANRADFFTVLLNVERLLLRASFHTAQTISV